MNHTKSISFSILKLLRAAVSYSPMSMSVVTCDGFHIIAKCIMEYEKK